MKKLLTVLLLLLVAMVSNVSFAWAEDAVETDNIVESIAEDDANAMEENSAEERIDWQDAEEKMVIYPEPPPGEEPTLIVLDKLMGYKELETPQKPVLWNGELLMPIRVIGEKLGWKIEWYEKDDTVIIRSERGKTATDEVEKVFTVKLGEKTAECQRYYEQYKEYSPYTEIIDMPIAPCLINGTAMVPEIIVGYLNCHVRYDEHAAYFSLYVPLRGP